MPEARRSRPAWSCGYDPRRAGAAVVPRSLSAPDAIHRRESALTDPITHNAELAVQRLQGRVPGAWDYSAASLEVVDLFLAAAAPQISKLAPGDAQALANIIGCYVLEVGLREHGGEYQRFAGRQESVLVVDRGTYQVALIPFDTVRARLAGRPGKPVALLYRQFSENVRSGAVGSRVLHGLDPALAPAASPGPG